MITIVAKGTIKKDHLHEFLELANKLAEESRKEPGCKEYQLYQDINNPQVLTFIEKWTDEKVIKEHNQTEHFSTIMPKLKEFEEIPMEVNLYKAV